MALMIHDTEVPGRHFPDITHPEDRVADLEGYRRHGRGNGSGSQKEKRYVRKDGATLWADLKRNFPFRSPRAP